MADHIESISEVIKLRNKDYTPVFCYGSNNPDQLTQRLGAAPKIIGAQLRGYQRIFRGYSKTWDGGGVASLQEAQPDDNVLGLVAFLSKEDILRLDKFEGWRPDQSGYTIKKNLKVYLKLTDPTQPEAAVKMTALCYLGTAKEKNAPALRYLQAIAKTMNAFWRKRGGALFQPKDITIN